MKCATTDCPRDASTLISFPWSEETPACDVHVGVARKMMVSLGREPELRLLPLPEETAPATPRDGKPALGTGPQIDRRLELLEAQHKALGLELELELQRQSRVMAELELVHAAKACIADARSFFGHVSQFLEAERGETTVVEGAPASPEPRRDPPPYPA